MRPDPTPPLDPLARRAAIDALEAQRAAYHRYARQLEAERAALGDGDGDRATRAAELAARGFAELQEGARRLAPLVEGATRGGDAEAAREIARQMAQLAAEARGVEVAIQNLALQLEAWRDAYGRQLAELGLAPGGAAAADPRSVPYGGAPGAGGARDATRVTLIDRRG